MLSDWTATTIAERYPAPGAQRLSPEALLSGAVSWLRLRI